MSKSDPALDSSKTEVLPCFIILNFVQINYQLKQKTNLGTFLAAVVKEG